MRFCLLFLSLFLCRDASALDCGYIVRALNAGVEPNFILEALESSKESFSTEDVLCLEENGVPLEIIELAETMVDPDKETPINNGIKDLDSEGLSTVSSFDAYSGYSLLKESTKGNCLIDFENTSYLTIDIRPTTPNTQPEWWDEKMESFR